MLGAFADGACLGIAFAFFQGAIGQVLDREGWRLFPKPDRRWTNIVRVLVLLGLAAMFVSIVIVYDWSDMPPFKAVENFGTAKAALLVAPIGLALWFMIKYGQRS